jgi:hypothetical protein
MSCGLKSEWSDKLFSSSATPMEFQNYSDGKLLLTEEKLLLTDGMNRPFLYTMCAAYPTHRD